MSVTDVKPGMPLTRTAVWIAAARPKTLWAGIVPVWVGTAMALGDGVFHLWSAFAALVGSVLIQIGTNIANDYSDFMKGADTEARQGPLRVTQAGLVPPRVVRNAAIGTFAAAFLVGLYLIARGGWPVLLIGVLSIVSGWLYTGGPRPLGYLGLGDLFVLIFFGPVAVGGTYYVQALHVTMPVLWAGISTGLLAVAILVVNNLRDIEQDGEAGKRTLAVRFGVSFTRMQYVVSLVGAVAIPVVMAVVLDARMGLLLCLLLLPLAFPVVRGLYRSSGPALNPYLGRTAALMLVFSLLFGVGWTLGF